jgi:hypothetical protein
MDQTLGEAKNAVSDARLSTRIRLLKWTSRRQAALRGFADLQLPNGLSIYGCPVLFSHGRAWATFPARPQIGSDGQVIKVDNKTQYTRLIEWSNRGVADRFSAAVVNLVRASEPEAFAGDEFIEGENR